MKVLSTVLKVVIALAAVAGAVYVIATYGDKIVAWAKKMLGCTDCCQLVEDEAVEAVADGVEETSEEVAAPVEEVEPAMEEASEEAPVESDFEG